jgi:anthranilate phosphoribosyltransferase
MSPQEALTRCIEHREIFHDEMLELMRQIMSGEMSPVMIAAITTALRVKKETIGEIAAAAQVMREFATKVPVKDAGAVVDIVGTGGDGAHTFNVSTTSMFVCAAAGAKVAKHGGRSVSSKSGSADVLEAAGVRLDLKPDQVARCVAEVGVGFMFAPAHHGAMKHAIGPRRELGVRTVFNILGPLTNPAGVPNQVLGVLSEDLLAPLAQVLQRLGSRHVLVVHARDGLDEISIGDRTEVAELKDGEIRRYSLAPEDFGLQRSSIDAIRVADPQESLAMLLGVLEDHPGPARDIVALNAGAAIYAAGLADTLIEGVVRADAAIGGGGARNCLDRLVVLTQSFD